MSFTKILSHPDKSTIIRMLTQGQGVRKVAKYLKEKYPNEKGKHISVPTMQKFRKEHLNIEGEALEMIKEKQKQKKEVSEGKKVKREVKKTYAYQKAIEEAADMHVDIKKELAEILSLVKVRISDLFDKAADGEITVNEEANLQKYFPVVGKTLDQWMKYVEKVADHTIDTNINITVIEDQMGLIREAVRETFLDMDPTLAVKFLDNLNKKMDHLNYRKPVASFEQIRDNTQKISSKMIDVASEDKE